jgi:carbonic anhydrase
MNDHGLCMKRSAFIAGLSLLAAIRGEMVLAANEKSPMSPGEALKKLMDGNRFFADSMKRKKQTLEERAALGAGQTPFASILCCADSRTTPEIVFHQGLGDIFVVRVAGNVATATERASLEYGSEVLKSPLILVMGHSSCGAVKAAIGATKGETFPGEIQQLAAMIKPAAESTKAMSGDWLENATKQNVRNVMKGLGESTVLAGLVKSGALKIAGAYYSLATGIVTPVS